MTHSPASLTIAEASALLASGAATSTSLVEACLEQIERRQPELNAFITVMGDTALADARSADRARARGAACGPLHGIPVSLKDLIDVEGVPTTAASRVRAGHVATADAPLVRSLRQAGAILIGKCNLHEFAFGTTNEDSAFGPARNPHDPSRSPGGSSGGSAAAVAAGMCFASIGSDTGGSIRIPASACGLVGLKPTFGEVSCDGVVPLGTSLDHVGPLARSVTDAEWLLAALKGEGRTSSDGTGLTTEKAVLRAGVPRAYFLDRLDDDVRGRFDAIVLMLSDAGVVVMDVEIPHARETSAIYLHTVLAEAAEYHARTLETRASDYTPAVRSRLQMARYVLAEDYVRAQRGRSVLRHEVDRALAGHDVLMLPTLPIPPQPIGATTVQVGRETDTVRSAMLRLTQLFNLTGHPAISLPAGITPPNLPFGLQLVGRRGRTSDLLATARACERLLAGARSPSE